MFRLNFLLLILSLAYGYTAFAQADFENVDSTTYRQYLNNEWKPLIKTGKAASKGGLDYYYLNMRVGIAYFNKLQYYKAASWFKKALKNDSYSDAAKEYLFWSDLLSGDTREADDTYSSLSDSVQQRIRYKIKKPFESIYAEGGIKISDNTPIAGHIGYAQLGFNHKFNRVFSIYHAYTFQMQKQVWGHYQQHQYYFAPSLRFKKDLTLNIAFHYSHYSGVIDFSDFKVDPPILPLFPPPPFFRELSGFHTIRKLGTFKEDLLLTQVSVSKTIKGFTIAPHAGFFVNFQNPDYTDTHRDSFVIAFHHMQAIDSTRDSIVGGGALISKETRFEAMFGLALSYNFGRVELGADVTAILNKKIKTAVVTPWIRAVLSRKVALKATYMYKGAYPLALVDGSQLYNSLDKIKYKASLTGEFFPVKKLALYLTYQFEGITDSFSNKDYNLHTLLIGLNLKL